MADFDASGLLAAGLVAVVGSVVVALLVVVANCVLVRHKPKTSLWKHLRDRNIKPTTPANKHDVDYTEKDARGRTWIVVDRKGTKEWELKDGDKGAHRGLIAAFVLCVVIVGCGIALTSAVDEIFDVLHMLEGKEREIVTLITEAPANCFPQSLQDSVKATNEQFNAVDGQLTVVGRGEATSATLMTFVVPAALLIVALVINPYPCRGCLGSALFAMLITMFGGAALFATTTFVCDLRKELPHDFNYFINKKAPQGDLPWIDPQDLTLLEGLLDANPQCDPNRVLRSWLAPGPLSVEYDAMESSACTDIPGLTIAVLVVGFLAVAAVTTSACLFRGYCWRKSEPKPLAAVMETLL